MLSRFFKVGYASRPPILRVTERAIERLRELSAKDEKYLKVGIKSKGCSGLVYTIDYVKEKGKLDELIQQDGVTILVDNKAIFSILGSTMDYKEDDISSQFTFDNPNVKDVCGCGQSFLV